MSLPCLGARKDDLLLKLAVHKVFSVELKLLLGVQARFHSDAW